MEKEDWLRLIKNLRDVLNTQKRNFKQSIDIIITFKKGVQPNIEGLLYLPKYYRTNLIAGFVDDDMRDSKVFDLTIHKSQFNEYDKKKIKKLGKQYDFFFGETTVMPLVVAKFGKILVSYGKMPSPKFGTVFTPGSDVSKTVEKLKSAIAITTKKNRAVQVKIGDESMSDEDLALNAEAVYNFVTTFVNPLAIRKIYLKGTMTSPIKI
jgi:large subunit ribosomal protein L1